MLLLFSEDTLREYLLAETEVKVNGDTVQFNVLFGKCDREKGQVKNQYQFSIYLVKKSKRKKEKEKL